MKHRVCSYIQATIVYIMSHLKPLYSHYIKMNSSEKIANDLEISLFDVENELEYVRTKKDSKRNALRVWILRSRSKQLFKQFLSTTYAQSVQWWYEIRNFERRIMSVKQLLSQNWFQLG